MGRCRRLSIDTVDLEFSDCESMQLPSGRPSRWDTWSRVRVSSEREITVGSPRLQVPSHRVSDSPWRMQRWPSVFPLLVARDRCAPQGHNVALFTPLSFLHHTSSASSLFRPSDHLTCFDLKSNNTYRQSNMAAQDAAAAIETMNAIVVETYGGIDNLVSKRVPKPHPGPQDLLVR